MAEPADPDRVDADREALLGALERHRVAFVLIGGAAIQSHGRRFDTQDIDLTPDTEPANLLRLARALNKLQCRLITDPADADTWVELPRDYFTASSLRASSIWNLATSYGQLDLAFAPTGFPDGYRDPVTRASRRPVAGTTIVVPVAALEDVHESKRQADRAKDREYLRRLDQP